MAHNLPVDLGIDGLEDPVVVGEGGFALVYRARQPAFRREVAVKVLTVGDLDDEAALRFERECQAMGAVSGHPHIVTVHGAGFTATGRPYLVMAYLPGGSLQEHVDREGPLGWTAATLQGVHLAGALETAHRAGIVHRDVKPGNVLLSGYGEVQLTDFGIARIAGARETARGVVTASVAHAAPEVVDGQRPSVAADVYSLASTLHELLAGRPAFVRPGDQSILPVLRRIGDEPPPDLRPRGIPDGVVAVLERAMAKDPAGRFATAADFGRALQAARYHLDLDPGRLSIPPAAGAAPSPASPAGISPSTSPAERPLPPPPGRPPAGQAATTAAGTRPLPGPVPEPAAAGDEPALPSALGASRGPALPPPPAGPGETAGGAGVSGPPAGAPPDASRPVAPADAGGTEAAGRPGADAPAAGMPPPRETVRLDRHHLGRAPGSAPWGRSVGGPPSHPSGAPPPPDGPGRRHAVVEAGAATRPPVGRPAAGAGPASPRHGGSSGGPNGPAPLVAAALVAVVALGGVAGVGLWRARTPEPGPQPPGTLAATSGVAAVPAGVPRYAAEYSEQARIDFFGPCGEKHPPAYCECAWAAIRENLPWAEYVHIDEELTADRRKQVDDTPLAGYLRPCEAAYPSEATTVSPSPRRT
jgi:hypothetical protein